VREGVYDKLKMVSLSNHLQKGEIPLFGYFFPAGQAGKRG
jgi:hypothetical protein